MPVQTGTIRAPIRPFTVGLTLTAAGLLLVLGAFRGVALQFNSDTLPLYSAGLVYIGLLAYWECTRARTAVLPSWASPPALIAGWALGWIYLPALLAFFDQALWDEDDFARGGETLLVTGILLACVALTALSFSYHATSRVLARRRPAAAPEQASALPFVLALYLLSVAARAFRLFVLGIAFGADRASWGALQSVDQWIGYIEDLRFLALVCLVAHVIRQRSGHPWLWGALAIEVMVGATSGFLMHLIRPLVACLAAAAALDRLRMRHFALLGVAVLLVLTFFPVVMSIRQDRTGEIGTSYRGGVSSALSDTSSYWLDGLGRLDSAYVKFFGRQTEVASSTGLVVAFTPEIVPYEGMRQFLLLPANLIPRVLWPDKPVLTRGVWFSVVFRGLGEDTTSWSAMTIFAEGYLFFGWTGVVLAMLIAGVVTAVFHRSFDSSRWALVYLALVPTILEIEPEFSSYLTTLLQRALIFAAVFAMMTHASSAAHRRLRT